MIINKLIKYSPPPLMDSVPEGLKELVNLAGFVEKIQKLVDGCVRKNPDTPNYSNVLHGLDFNLSSYEISIDDDLNSELIPCKKVPMIPMSSSFYIRRDSVNQCYLMVVIPTPDKFIYIGHNVIVIPSPEEVIYIDQEGVCWEVDDPESESEFEFEFERSK